MGRPAAAAVARAADRAKVCRGTPQAFQPSAARPASSATHSELPPAHSLGASGGRGLGGRFSRRANPSSLVTVPAEMPAGSAMLYLGSVWHGGGANRTDRARLGVAIEYVAGWLRPQETQLLAVPPEVARALPVRLQELLGYDVYPPFVGYVDGRHPRRVLEA